MNHFDNYHQSFNSTQGEISQLISEIERSSNDQAVARNTRDIHQGIESLKNNLRSMEMELSGLGALVRSRYESQVNQCKSQVQTLERRFAQAKDSSRRNIERENLFGGTSATTTMAHDSLTTATRDLDRLKGASRTTNDLVNLGGEMLGRLHEQGQRLENTERTLDRGHAEVDRGESLISTMRRRVTTNKCIQYCIIFVLIALIAFLLFILITR
ncbi:hypothetical protein PCE1_003231 [Barthelona sp. PCE]